jgi:hypothetical protein
MYRGGLNDKAMPAVGMTWLPQCQSDSGVALLRDYPAEVVSIECDTCGCVDRYRLVALVARFGPAAKLSDVLFVLSTDCPRQRDLRFTEPCIASFPALLAQLQATAANP